MFVECLLRGFLVMLVFGLVKIIVDSKDNKPAIYIIVDAMLYTTIFYLIGRGTLGLP